MFLLPNILHKLELSGRLAKFTIKLNQYKIINQPHPSIKSQVLENFVADFSTGIYTETEKETIISSVSVPKLGLFYGWFI